MVAPFGNLQQASFDEAGSGNIADLIGRYTGATAGSVAANPIYAGMGPYMNQFVAQALAPQIQAQDIQFAQQRQAGDAAATSDNAFGDARAGIYQANLTQNQDIARAGLLGNAYTNAFNTAIGASAQDTANSLNAQQFNVNQGNLATNRLLTGAQALQGNIGFQNTLGQQQTAQGQAQLNALYNQWLMKQQYPFQTIGSLDQALQASRGTTPTTQVQQTQSPDNSGFGILGSIAGSVLGGPIGGQIGGSLGNWFAGGGGSTYNGYNNVQAGQGYGVGFDQYGNPLPGYAEGGEPPVGRPAVVGEQGPEMFVPHFDVFGSNTPQMVGEHGPEIIQPLTPGTVIPHEKLNARLQRKGLKKTRANSLEDAFSLAA